MLFKVGLIISGLIAIIALVGVGIGRDEEERYISIRVSMCGIGLFILICILESFCNGLAKKYTNTTDTIEEVKNNVLPEEIIENTDKAMQAEYTFHDLANSVEEAGNSLLAAAEKIFIIFFALGVLAIIIFGACKLYEYIKSRASYEKEIQTVIDKFIKNTGVTHLREKLYEVAHIAATGDTEWKNILNGLEESKSIEEWKAQTTDDTLIIGILTLPGLEIVNSNFTKEQVVYFYKQLIRDINAGTVSLDTLNRINNTMITYSDITAVWNDNKDEIEKPNIPLVPYEASIFSKYSN